MDRVVAMFVPRYGLAVRRRLTERAPSIMLVLVGALALLFGAFGCNVDRDLSAGRFACDVGGKCPGATTDGGPGRTDAEPSDSGGSDAGAVVRTCAAVATCYCYEGEDCTLACALTCDVICATNSSCSVTCGAGGCEVTCGENSDCHLDCPVGGCMMQCGANSNCTYSCLAGACTCVGSGCP